MPIIDGIGVSKLTAIKEKHFRMIVSMHLRIVKGILSRNSWADQKYWYIDMNAGQGYNRIPDSDQVVMGSPVQFLEAAIESSSKFRAIFVERDKKSALKLTCIVKGIDPSAHVINSDHAMVARALCEYEPSGPPPFGMLYSDPNDFIPWDAIGSISNLDRFSKLDVLLHVPATTLKRVRHLEGYPTLVEGMRKIKKTHWLIRNPLGANQFTFLIGTNWDAFPLLKGLGFHNLDTPDGQEVLNHLNFTEKQLKNGCCLSQQELPI